MRDKKENTKKTKKRLFSIQAGREKSQGTHPIRKRKTVKKKKFRPQDLKLSGAMPLAFLKSACVWIFEIAVVILLAFVFVWYFGQRISNVGDSMNPKLKNGDVVLVNQFVYNTSSPKRGDIIAFKPKGNENSHYYIKRIIGLPGETVEIIEGRVYIDGKKLDETYEATRIADVGIVTEKMTLEGDEYFVLGDDRNRSEDSRMADVGNVKRAYIYGKVWCILSPVNRMSIVR